MALPLVSVITPCYRQARFLAAALESVRAQSYPAIESIVVNDGSDDDTEAVAARFADGTRYIWQPNAGLSSARNTGIAAARGDYFLFLDSDDCLHPDAVSWLADAAHGRDDVLCVMGFRRFERDGECSDSIDQLPPPESTVSHVLLTRNPCPPHCHFVPRSLVNAAGTFDPSLKSCEDWDLWLRFMFHGAEIRTINRVGAYYRQHPTSMSTNALRMAQTRSTVMVRTLRHLEASPDFLARQGLDLRTASTTVRTQLMKDLLDAAFLARQRGTYLAALNYYYLSVRQSRLSHKALLGAAKLLPHWLLRPVLTTSQ
jgi:glycosyltransferase involved in cell wall biosynthesis